MLQQLIDQGRQAISDMARAEEDRTKAQAVRDHVMRQMYDGGRGEKPPAIGRALGISTSLVRYTVCTPGGRDTSPEPVSPF